MILGFLASGIEAPAIDAGKEKLTCPHCTAAFQCKEVENLDGELLLTCPHGKCQHQQLSGPLGVDQVITCAACKRGYTVGMAKETKGTLLGRHDPPAAAANCTLQVRFQCRQITHVFEYGAAAGNQSAEHPLEKDFAMPLEEPTSGTARVEHKCPCCTSELIFHVQSLDAAQRKADFLRRLANFGVWALAAIPLVGIFIAVRSFLLQDTSNLAAIDTVAAIGGIVLSIAGLVSLWLRSDAYRRQSLLLSSRISLQPNTVDHSLWRTTSMSTKGARLEVTHRLLAVENVLA